MSVALPRHGGLRGSDTSPARTSRRIATSLRVERLEARSLMATGVTNGPVVVQSGSPDETLDQAVDLGDLTGSPGVETQGTLGSGSCGSSDVEWYRFTLDHAARFSADLSRQPQSAAFRGVLSLFNNDPYDSLDPYNPSGHRLLAQAVEESEAAPAAIDRLLGPGTYFVAVSGAGNIAFHPLIAGSGLPGCSGDFQLVANVTDVGPGPGDGPIVLTSDPPAGAQLTASPFVIRVEMSGLLDATTIWSDLNVNLFYTQNAAVSPTSGQDIVVNSINWSDSACELQLIVGVPLGPGHYTVVLSGDSSTGMPALAAPDGTPLAADAANTLGQDQSFSFDINGAEGIPGNSSSSDDTPSTAHDLGNVTTTGLVQVSGAIGDAPFYNPASSGDPNIGDPINNPGNDVDLYHFQITGAGRYTFLAEVFAGRIGSPLDPGIALYRVDPTDHSLHLVDGNNNTYNPTLTTDHFAVPLYSDSVLYESLVAGDYELAVAGGSNVPSPHENLPEGSPGLLDPTVTHSASNGWSTGPYLLNLLVHEAQSPPHVVSTNLKEGVVLDAPPTSLDVTFDAPVNIAQLAFQTFQKTAQENITAIYVQAADGTKYFPRFLSYDSTTHEAQFVMLDGLANGTYQLHLSGQDGLEDLAGNPLVGNRPDGDYIVDFTVDSAPRGVGGNPLIRYSQEPNDTAGTAQDLGVIFPREFQSTVDIFRPTAEEGFPTTGDSADVYRFQVIQNQVYGFQLSGNLDSASAVLSLTDAAGDSAAMNVLYGGKLLFGHLAPGTYLLTASGWNPGQAADLTYQIHLSIVAKSENAPPLLTGPAPALALRLESTGSSSGGTSTPVITVNPPPSSGGTVNPTGPFSSGGPAAGLAGAVTPIVASTGSTSPSVSSIPLVVIAPTSSSQGMAGASALLGLGFSPVGGVPAPSSESTASMPIVQALATALNTTFIGMSLATTAPGAEPLPSDPPSLAQSPEPGSAEKDIVTPDGGGMTAALSKAVDEVAGMVPDLLGRLVTSNQVPESASLTAASATAQAVEADTGQHVVQAALFAPGEVAAATSSWNLAWPIVLGGLGAASIVYARSRTPSGRDEDEGKPRHGVHWLERGSSLRAALRTIPRIPLALLANRPPSTLPAPGARTDLGGDLEGASSPKRRRIRGAMHRGRVNDDPTVRLMR